jgi:hypothetical protein
MATFWVNGIVSNRDQQPYVQLSNEKGMIAQLSMGEARQIALDMLVMSARAEMDAMVLSWVREFLPDETAGIAAAGMMQQFRDYRARLDDEKIEHDHRGEVEG